MPVSTELTIHWLDALVIIVYLAMLLLIGSIHFRRQSNLTDFFLAGREMRWFVVGASLMAALNSGIDYLMQPSAMIKFGVYTMVGNFSWLLLYPYVFFVTLPLYRRMGVISAYEYLERRFSIGVRTLTAGIFVLWRLGWLATALYVPALALSVLTGNQVSAVTLILVIGTVVTLYTMMGGIRAVIWTDLMQFFIMFTGLAVTIVIVLKNVDGGFLEILGNWNQIGKEAITRLSPAAAEGGLISKMTGFFLIPMTLTGVFMATMVARLTTYTSDQVMVQRFQTARTIRDARQGFVITAASDFVWMMALAFIGLALFTFFQASFGGLPDWALDHPDQIYPYFMTQVFPIGMTGLVVAAILAASLSSIDSAINSLTSVVMVDFYRRLYRGETIGHEDKSKGADRRQVRVSRIITVLVGITGITLSCNVSKLGSLIEISNKLINSFTGPILGIFLLGMFTRRANARSVLIGGTIGVLVTLFTAFQEQIYDLLNIRADEFISFLWPSTFGFLATFLIGYASSLMTGSAGLEKAREWNWFSVTSRKLEE
jgi:SSS family transporter